MYGSSFQFEQTLNTNRELRTTSAKSDKTWITLIFTFVVLAISTASYAGPSTPRLPGGNGNANGR